jgi:hypothetical protein
MYLVTGMLLELERNLEFVDPLELELQLLWLSLSPPEYGEAFVIFLGLGLGMCTIAERTFTAFVFSVGVIESTCTGTSTSS